MAAVSLTARAHASGMSEPLIGGCASRLPNSTSDLVGSLQFVRLGGTAEVSNAGVDRGRRTSRDDRFLCMSEQRCRSSASAYDCGTCRYLAAPPSPTTTNGAHTAGCAAGVQCAGRDRSTMAISIARRKASARPMAVANAAGAPTATDDGLLTASEVTVLELNADWVVLSACNTAAGGEKGDAEAFSGLARAFFYEGASASRLALVCRQSGCRDNHDGCVCRIATSSACLLVPVLPNREPNDCGRSPREYGVHACGGAMEPCMRRHFAWGADIE
jgi:hypothetical protein